MEEDTSQPSAPSNGANGEVVNLEDIQQNDDESFESFVRRFDAEYFEPVDLSAKSPESEWDTSLVNRPHLESTDVAVPSRDYHALLFTARVDLAEDQDLKLPWETGILKTIFDEESDIVSCLPRSCLFQVRYLVLGLTTAVPQAVWNLKRRLFLGCQGIFHYQFMLVQSK